MDNIVFAYIDIRNVHRSKHVWTQDPAEFNPHACEGAPTKPMKISKWVAALRLAALDDYVIGIRSPRASACL